MDLKELKARAYDLITVLEQARQQLDQVNREIARLAAEPVPVAAAVEEIKPEA